jgi:hypothetical protein
MDWKRCIQFALQGSSDLEQYAILGYAFPSGCSSLSPGQTSCLWPAARNLFTRRS